MPQTSYNYLRAVELEGRHPQDAGVWGITLSRMSVGEGLVPRFAAQGFVEGTEQAVLPAVPRIDGGWRGYVTYYRSLNGINALKDYLDKNKINIRTDKGGVEVSVPLLGDWAHAPLGRIPLVNFRQEESVLSHAIVIKEYDDARQEFKFFNNWPNWGDDSHGYLPYDYFTRYAFDCRVSAVVTHFLRDKQEPVAGLGTYRSWTARTTHDQRVYGFEFLDANGNKFDRTAWCFLTEFADHLTIEDFYVRPEYRRQGYGRALADRVRGFAEGRGKPVIFPISFADCRSESPATYDAMVATVRHLGLVFSQSDSHFAAYLAHAPGWGKDGSSTPIEPDFVPLRPKSSLAQALAAFALMSGGVESTPFQPQSPTAVPAVSGSANAVPATGQIFPEVGTAAWDTMNRRRNELIRKKVRQGLDGLATDERREYEWLQAMSLRSVQARAERPTPLQREWEAIQRSLSQE